MHVFSDDVGSFPLPPGAAKDKLRSLASDLARGGSPQEEHVFSDAVAQILNRKIAAGVERPNYPQLQDMVSGFSDLIENFYEEDDPWVVRKEYAQIPEIAAVEEAAACLDKRIELRVCVTGPLELYTKRVGLQVEGGLLRNLAKSVSRFIESALLDGKKVETTTVSIDEPSLGLNPNLVVDREDLIKALDLAAKPARDLDVQIHLHSPNSVDAVYETKYVKIIGVESAGDVRALEDIDPSDLRSHDKFLRAGVSRTNIYQIMADSGLQDPWKEPAAVVNRLESPAVIGRRLRKAYKIFGSRIRYAGPDCGLGAWPDQESAFVLLRNTAKAVASFNSALRRA